MARGGEADEGRAWVARAFTHVEDAVYLGVGLLLALSAIALLVDSGIVVGARDNCGDECALAATMHRARAINVA